MRGEAIKCDNCGVVGFYPTENSRYGRLARLLIGNDEEESGTKPVPSIWKSVGYEELSKDGEEVEQLVKHYCSNACLEFAVRYIFNKETPETYRGEK